MSTSVKCTLCKEEFAIVSCHECQTLVCKSCSAVCRECGTSICTPHTQRTKAGTPLCPGCMAEREARRQALRDKYGKGAHKKTAPPVSAPVAPTSSPASPSSPADSTRLEDLMGGEQLLKPLADNIEDRIEEEIEESHHADTYEKLPPEERQEASFTETGRLELPPMDQSRPVLGQSGYQPPSRGTMTLVIIFFGSAMLFTIRVVPALHDTLFPFGDSNDTEFTENLMPIATDTNALRNTSNIQSLDVFAQSATFFIAWGFVLVYCGLVLGLIFGLIRSMLLQKQAKEQHEAVKDLDQKSKDLYL